MDRPGRACQTALEDGAHERDAVLPPSGCLRQKLVDVRRDRLVDRELLRPEFEADGVHVPVGEQSAAMQVLQVFLQPPERPRTIRAKPQNVAANLPGYLTESMWLGEQIAIDEADKVRETSIISVMGRRSQKQQIVALLGKPFSELVPLRALDFVATAHRTLRVGAALVGLVDDDEVPSLLPHPLAHAILFGVVDGRDDLRFPLPQVQELLLIVRGVNDLERLVEEPEQLVLPLDGQWCRDKNQAAVNGFSKLQLLD